MGTTAPCVLCETPCEALSPTGACPSCQDVADRIARAYGRILERMAADAEAAEVDLSTVDGDGVL